MASVAGRPKPNYYGRPWRRPYRRHQANCQSIRRPIVPRQVEEQNDELLALTSIYEADVIHVDAERFAGHFFAHVHLPKQPFFLAGLDKLPAAVAANECRVEFLPPLTLSFRLPPDYPAVCKPHFRIACKWLNKKQLSDLCAHLDRLWEEQRGEVILYHWCSFLTECLLVLGIKDCLDLSWASKSLSDKPIQNNGFAEPSPDPAADSDCRTGTAAGRRRGPHYRIREPGDPRAIVTTCHLAALLTDLLEYDQQQQERRFLTAQVECNVCFEAKSGAQCLRFKGCDHVSCRSCLRDYFEVQIRDGRADRLNCPMENCKSQATPSQVRELVGNELFARYDELLLASTLQSMSDVVYCPRIACQCPILIESESTMGACPACRFVFCIFCRMAYHGVEPCRIKSEECRQLYKSYMEGSEDQKTFLEAKYGRKQLQQLLELTMSENWLEENSKECPHCKAHIEKVDGCNKMTCWKCGKYFCWICMAKLSSEKPYEHYDQRGTSCFEQLFAGVDVLDDQEDEEDEFLDGEDEVQIGEYV